MKKGAATLMAKYKYYKVYEAGGSETGDIIMATCITKATKQFIQTLEKECTYKIESKEQSSVQYKDNHSICGDYVILEI